MKLNCSQCGNTYDFEYNKDKPLPTNFPFCSKRCKSIDLGKWLNEEYRIRTPILENSESDETSESILSDLHEEYILQFLQDKEESE